VIAHKLLSRLADVFLIKESKAISQLDADSDGHAFPEIKEYLEKFQDTESLKEDEFKDEKPLSETEITFHDGIGGILGKGERIDELVAQKEKLGRPSDVYTAHPKLFYTQVRLPFGLCPQMLTLENNLGEKAEFMVYYYVIP
jgi:hypothetical protein